MGWGFKVTRQCSYKSLALIQHAVLFLCSYNDGRQYMFWTQLDIGSLMRLVNLAK